MMYCDISDKAVQRNKISLLPITALLWVLIAIRKLLQYYLLVVAQYFKVFFFYILVVYTPTIPLSWLSFSEPYIFALYYFCPFSPNLILFNIM